ncbi:MAG: tRNA lysidine(34) synthetase TilS [Lachnospiraceae bacterium]|nr:tRNA lysidine(34) synthetase TilS [Lachnospiraceae bacterium]
MKRFEGTIKGMKEKVLKTILERQLIGAGDRVLLGCSGGADSMCLLHLLSLLQEPLDFTLYAVHVHHHIRGKSADEDAKFVEKACEEYGVPCSVIHKDVLAFKEEKRLSTEEAARTLRYEAFLEEAERVHADRLAVAHHMEDRAETMLFQMIRGSLLSGSAGMKIKSAYKDLPVIRPLLDVSKEEILQYDEENGISWREDETNLKDNADRNRIRHHVLPALQNTRPDAAKKLSSLGEYFAEVDDYLRAEANAWTSVYMRNDPYTIPEDPFKDTPKILQEYIVRDVLRRLDVPMKDKGRTHIDSIAMLIHAQVGKRILILNQCEAVRTYQGIAFQNEGRKETEKPYVPADALILETRVFPYEKGMEIPRKEYTKWFDYDKMKGPLKLRSRMPHDYFSQAKGARKKLKDFFIDEKIPKNERDGIALVADGNTVVWIIGVRMSEEHKVTEDTKNILEITVRRKEK